MRGTDVKNVQRALAAAKISVEQDGEYDSATAGAVARFQKQNGLNVSGVVDAATRRRLGELGEPPRQGGRN
jgi:peptidoglycan hydrolase-like protein with peptidoglycan-binding domain